MLWQLAVMVPLLLAAYFHHAYQMPRFIAPLTRVAEEIAEEVLLVKNLQLTLHAAAMPVNDYLIHGLSREREAFKSQQQRVNKGFLAAKKAPFADPHERELVEEAWQEWRYAAALGVKLLAIDNPVGKAGLGETMERFDHHIDEASARLEELYKRAHEEIIEAQSEARHAHDESQNVTVMAFAVAIVLSALIGSALVQTILRNLESLCQGAKQIAAGELGQHVQKPSDQSIHELEELTDAFNSMALKLQAHDAVLQNMATQDALTGLDNRRALDVGLKEELQRAQRYERPVTLLMIDIDHFKEVNDNYGHLAGDAVLRQLSAICQGVVRPMDHIYRYGGEEFVVLLPETDIAGACVLAERLREEVESTHFALSGDGDIQMTISIGIAVYPKDADTTEDLLAAADRALYEAKQGGRNRVCMQKGMT
jgi:diguanylate cyclase (GGDEF)-like protein